MYNRVNPKTSKTVSLDLKLLVTIFRLQYTSLASMARHFQMKDSIEQNGFRVILKFDMYCMSQRYWDNFSNLYLQLESLFLGTDSNPMTHETWQAAYLNSYWKLLPIKIIFLRFQHLEIFSYNIKNPFLGTWTHTQEPVCTVIVYSGPVLGNVDPYLGTWTRTWELLFWCNSEFFQGT